MKGKNGMYVFTKRYQLKFIVLLQLLKCQISDADADLVVKKLMFLRYEFIVISHLTSKI